MKFHPSREFNQRHSSLKVEHDTTRLRGLARQDLEPSMQLFQYHYLIFNLPVCIFVNRLGTFSPSHTNSEDLMNIVLNVMRV